MLETRGWEQVTGRVLVLIAGPEPERVSLGDSAGRLKLFQRSLARALAKRGVTVKIGYHAVIVEVEHRVPKKLLTLSSTSSRSAPRRIKA